MKNRHQLELFKFQPPPDDYVTRGNTTSLIRLPYTWAGCEADVIDLNNRVLAKRQRPR